jgi:hypothetical protein
MANCTIVTIKNARVGSEQVPVSDRSSAEWCALLRAAAEVGKIGAEETVPCCVLVSQEHPRQQGCASISACRTLDFPLRKCTNLNSNNEADGDRSNLSGGLKCIKTQKRVLCIIKTRSVLAHPHMTKDGDIQCCICVMIVAVCYKRPCPDLR